MELEHQQADLQNTMYDFCEGPCQAKQILQVLNTYRQSATLTDVVLQVDDSEFPCHRAILSASCLYFDAMFNGKLCESRLSVVPIQGITAFGMETVLNFLYEGKVVLDEENVESIFCTADLLGVSALRKACVSFLEEHVDYSKCLGILDFAKSFFITPLVSKCENILYDGGFEEICKHKEFLSQAKEWVVELLTSDQLHVDREEILVEAVLKWVHHNPSERKGDLKELLELVCLPLVDPVFFVNTVETDELVQGCKECRPLLLEAQRFQVSGMEVDSPRTRPRRALGRAEMIVRFGWDDEDDDNPPFFRLDKLNPHTREWVPGASIPSQDLVVRAICELQNNIYVSGVCWKEDLEGVSQVWRYTPQLDHWVQIAPLAKARCGYRMAALHGKLYVVGGREDCDDCPLMSSVEVYSIYDNQWQTVAPLPLPGNPAVVSCLGKLYVFGGETMDRQFSNRVQCYDPQKDQWVDMGTCPFSKVSSSAVTHNSTIYLAGDYDQIYCYTPKTNDWSHVVTLPVGGGTLELTVCEGKVYVFAASVTGFSDDDEHMWTFCPQTRKLTEEEDPMTNWSRSYLYVTISQRLQQKNTIHSS